MYVDLGKVTPGTDLFVPFHTFDSNDPSASVTITGLATTDIEVYRDASMTQRASDAGFALVDTDGIDLDGTTGIHGVTIDLADNTTAGFYRAGSDYVVVIASITVDAATINFIPVRFRIGYESAMHETNIATLASQTSFTLTAGSADNDAFNGCPVLVHDVASAIQKCVGYVSDYVGATRTVTLAADPGIFTMAVNDNISFFMPSNVAAVAGTAQTANDNGADINTLLTRIVGTLAAGTHNAQSGDAFARLGAPAGVSVSADIAVIDTNVDDIETDTNELQGDWVNGGRLDLILDAIAADVVNIDGAAMRGTDNAALASVVGALTDVAAAGDPTTADTVMQYVKQLVNIFVGTDGITTFPAEAAPANNVSLAEVIRAIHTDVTGLNGDAMRGTDSGALASVCTEARLAELDAANLPTTTDNIETDTQDIQARLPAALVGGRMDSDLEAINNNTAAADNLAASARGLVTLTIGVGSTTTNIVSDLAEATNDHYNGRILIFYTGALAGQATDITDYDGTSNDLTVTALTEAPANGDLAVIA
jgi:hypothetical protein